MITIDPFLVIQKYNSDAPVKIYELINELGIDYIKFPLDENISGSIEKKKNDQYLIRINSSHSETRQRFTAAHELGHYIYHRKQINNQAIVDDRMYRRPKDKRQNEEIDQKKETQANQFAATLLMPYDVIVRLRNEGDSCDQIAEKLIVSKQAMKIRYDAIFPNG